MKKEITLILGILCLFHYCATAQSYKVVYGKLVQNNDDEIREIKDDNLRNSIISLNKSFSYVEYELIINGNKAKFQYIDKLESPNFNKRVISMGGGRDIYFYDNDKKIVLRETSLDDKNYIIEKPLLNNNWNITNETNFINNFLCFKAIANISVDDFRGKYNYNLIAWFCPELPFPYGPDKYFGLPGLVFEAYEEDAKIKFFLKEINKLETSTVIKFPINKSISEQEFTKIFDKLMNELVEQN